MGNEVMRFGILKKEVGSKSEISGEFGKGTREEEHGVGAIRCQLNGKTKVSLTTNYMLRIWTSRVWITAFALGWTKLELHWKEKPGKCVPI